MITIVVAYDQNFGIGFQGGLPWKPIQEDFKHFKNTTIGHSVIMGRKTYESLPNGYRPLPDRKNIVVSRLPPSSIEYDVAQGKVNVYHSLEVAINCLENNDAFLIGGGQLYKAALEADLVDKIIASEIYGVHQADTFFPKVNWKSEIKQEFVDFRIVHYSRN